MSDEKSKWINRLLVLIALTMASVYLFPLYWMFVTSLKTGSEVFATPPALWPEIAQWVNYQDVWQSKNMARYMGNLARFLRFSLWFFYSATPRGR